MGHVAWLKHQINSVNEVNEKQTFIQPATEDNSAPNGSSQIDMRIEVPDKN